MRTTRTTRSRCCVGFALAVFCTAHADWPMPGHDPGRSSWAEEEKISPDLRPIWCKKIGPYIPNKVQIITGCGRNGADDVLLVSTSRGVFALNPEQGNQVWHFATEMPVDQSPTLVDGVAYFGCTDKTVYAVDVKTGKPIWRTLRAGAAFDTNPVVAEERVLIGCRDSYFYCFDAKNGALVWHHKAEGPISFSAAYAGGTLYFACKYNYAYALDAKSGNLSWKSKQLPGAGFISWWPVIAGDVVLFPGTNNYGKGQGGASASQSG